MHAWRRIKEMAGALRRRAPPSADSGGVPAVADRELTGPNGAERRRHPRYAVSVPVFIGRPGDTPMRASIRDISEGGCLLETDSQVPLGTSVSLAFLMKPHGFCRAAGRVVRVMGTMGFGVKFTETNEGLVQFVSAVAALPPNERQEAIGRLMGSVLEVDSNVQSNELHIRLGPSSHADLLVMSRLSGKPITEIVEELIEDWSRKNSRRLGKARKRAAGAAS
jgi:hypothetical protein